MEKLPCEVGNIIAEYVGAGRTACCEVDRGEGGEDGRSARRNKECEFALVCRSFYHYCSTSTLWEEMFHTGCANAPQMKAKCKCCGGAVSPTEQKHEEDADDIVVNWRQRYVHLSKQKICGVCFSGPVPAGMEPSFDPLTKLQRIQHSFFAPTDVEEGEAQHNDTKTGEAMKKAFTSKLETLEDQMGFGFEVFQRSSAASGGYFHKLTSWLRSGGLTKMLLVGGNHSDKAATFLQGMQREGAKLQVGDGDSYRFETLFPRWNLPKVATFVHIEPYEANNKYALVREAASDAKAAIFMVSALPSTSVEYTRSLIQLFAREPYLHEVPFLIFLTQVNSTDSCSVDDAIHMLELDSVLKSHRMWGVFGTAFLAAPAHGEENQSMDATAAALGAGFNAGFEWLLYAVEATKQRQASLSKKTK